MPRHRRGWAMGNGYHQEDRHSPLSVSMLEPALLVLLQQQPRHGYNLLAELESLGLRSLHPSVIYRALRQMEGLDWICSDWDTSQSQGPPRRNYRLTDLGEKALQNWQEELSNTGILINELLKRSNYHQERS
jgi:DNA-binding PadR family transcriptional regulator